MKPKQHITIKSFKLQDPKPHLSSFDYENEQSPSLSKKSPQYVISIIICKINQFLI